MATSDISSLRIGHINAQSLEAHFVDIRALLVEKKLHILAISESWLKPSRSSKLLAVPNYNLVRVDRIGKGGGGIAIYIHVAIRYKSGSQSTQPSVYSKRPEFLFIQLSLPMYKILLGLVYSPPKCGFWSDVEEALLNCEVAADFVIVLGDFNINLDALSTPQKILSNFFRSSNLTPLPFHGTHHVGNPHSTIDYICVSDISKVKGHDQIHIPHISQHDALLAEFSFSLGRWVPRAIRTRNFRLFDHDQFLKDLRTIDWTPLHQAAHVDDKVDFFTCTITQLYDIHAPYRTFTPRKKPSPWMSPELKALIKSRNKAWRNFKRTGRTADHAIYKQFRNRVKTMVRNSISSYYKQAFYNATSSSETWRLVKNLGMGAKEKESTPLPADLDQMNRFFCGDSAPQPLHDSRPTARIAPDERFFFRHVNAAEITRAIMTSRSNARGSDDMPMRFLRDCLPHVLPVLMNIFDCSLQSGVFPSSWKRAVVRPIPKKSNPSQISDFRPISILCSASKILEAAALNQITEFTRSRGLLDDFQSGFRKHHSTHTALLSVLDDARKAIDDEEIMLLVGIDLTRAFDLVNVQLLIDKLRNFGFSDSACNWVFSFLSDRSQVVSADGSSSSPITRNCGVPQGSLNGPSFFSLFANDAPACLLFCSHHLYADDTTIYLRGHISELPSIVERVNSDLQRLASWAASNGLLINAAKTQAIWLGSRRFITQLHERDPPPLIINGQEIEYCTSFKLLGVVIDSTLTFSEQTAITYNKCFAALARLRKCRDYLPQHTKLMLVKSLVFPYLDYCASLFLDLSDELTHKLHKCKNAALRFATDRRKFDHISPAYEALEILPYAARRDFLSICLLVSIIRSGQPGYLAQYFKFRASERKGSKRACDLDLSIAWARTTTFQSSFRIGVARIWNDIPVELRLVFERPCFKERLKTYYVNKYL